MQDEKGILVWASGEKEGGGSGFQELVENSRSGILKAKIKAVVSNHEFGGVRGKSDLLKVPFIHFPKPWDEAGYRKIIEEVKPDLNAFSGWLKLAKGMDPKTSINIHPGFLKRPDENLPSFGGPGMYGHYVHEATMEAFRRGEVTHSAVTMHFMNEEFDRGPIFFRYPVIIREKDTPETLAARVNKIEHGWQSFITYLVLAGEISWDGEDPNSLVVPPWYKFHLWSLK